ncbi:hypothetical protein H0X48_03570 [Candidatus Dependentiae bacterium]|nr:hypothetical protein [Candidatus Dependentiae bacterium]
MKNNKHQELKEQDAFLEKALLESEDEFIVDESTEYGRDHDDRFIDHKRDGRPHECKGSQCEDSNLKP